MEIERTTFGTSTAYLIGHAPQQITRDALRWLEVPMSVRTEDSHPRSIAKAVSWRITGSVDTFLLSFLFTGSVKLAGSIAIAEMGTKMLLYYLHERAWSAIRWNQRGQSADGQN